MKMISCFRFNFKINSFTSFTTFDRRANQMCIQPLKIMVAYVPSGIADFR